MTACWLDAGSAEGQAYWEALQYVGRWTRANHECIHHGFARRLGTSIVAAVGNEHNFVWKRGTSCVMAGDGGPRPWAGELELTPKQKRQIEHRAERRKQHQGLTHWG